MLGPTPPTDDSMLAFNDPMSDPTLDPSLDPSQLEPDFPAEPVDPYADITDTQIARAVDEAYRTSKESRRPRHAMNDKNWASLHGKFEFLNRKQPGQSRIVIPSLETSLEQVCGQLTSQLVGFKNWFVAEYESGEPPLPDLDAEHAARILRQELERLAIDGNYLETTYGIQRLIYDSIKIGLIESTVTWKVSIAEIEREVYDFPDVDPMTGEVPPGVPPKIDTKIERRLKVEIVPFADHYPDPSQARMYDIHEVEVPISALPGLGFDDATIERMRASQGTSEKQEQTRVRAGSTTDVSQTKNRVLLREFWGDLIDPDNGKMLARNVMLMMCGPTLVVKRPVPISSVLWHGKRPFVSLPLIPTPTSTTHHAFLDITVPLVEIESELTNLVIDGGFNASHGIKEIRDYMLEDPSQLAKGLIPGIALRVAEGRGDGPVVTKVDTGTLPAEVLEVLDRISRMRQEAFRINDLQLGRLPPRKESATAITEVSESSNDLFSSIAQRFEDSGVEPLVELCWLTMWQYLDDFTHTGIPDEHQQSLEMMAPQERFVMMANGIRFKVQGYKFMQGAVKDSQKLVTMQNMIGSNPALMQIYEQEFSPLKSFRMIYRSLGIDPTDLRRDANEPYVDPALLAGQAGAPNAAPGAVSDMSQGMPPNPSGFRGTQNE